jgi:predicted O-methyltransferase YrrM
MRSSYIENNYGNVFKALVLAHKPNIVVECGVLDGYSTFNIAHALRANRIHEGILSSFVAYDLWEEYDYKHGDFGEVATMLREKGLLNHYVNLHYGDAFQVHENFMDGTVDFLHIDISNDGEVLEKIIINWWQKMAKGGIIAFEGGSLERDNIEWMKKFNKKPIVPVLEWLLDAEGLSFQVFTEFPSMTLIFKEDEKWFNVP